MSSTERVEIAINKIMHFVTGWLQINVIQKANEGNMDSSQRREARKGVWCSNRKARRKLNRKFSVEGRGVKRKTCGLAPKRD